MNRRKFIAIGGTAILAAGATGYLLSDKSNVARSDIPPTQPTNETLRPDEREILSLASLAPSGHNTQPWLVEYIAPYHWIIGNDKTRWLPAVDPAQRETLLSIGTFIQNLEYAAGSLGYLCSWSLLASTNQDERVVEVKLIKQGTVDTLDASTIRNRRTVRSDFKGDLLKKEDLDYIVGGETDLIRYLPATSKESTYIDEQTIEANRLQTYRDPAQEELSEWIRFSSKDAAKHLDGLTTASMEIEGVSGFVVRNFYDKNDVIKADFRETSLDKVRTQVSQSAGWIVITSKDDSVATLLETGRRMQRLFLKVRERGIAIHPMTQILEEASTNQALNSSIGMTDTIQFLLRVGYIENYPSPVSLRRPIDWFLRI